MDTVAPHLVRQSVSKYSPGDRSLCPAQDILFDTPDDLRCPITHEPFLQPVLTAGGHVYERGAIEKHLSLRVTDPLTGVALPNRTLTPVYILQSRALEYRQRTAQACVDAASAGPLDQSSATVPASDRPRADFLRRAADLVAGSGLTIQGLTPETIDYVINHPGPSYDTMALIAFARGLFHAGLRDRAAHVYWSLLQASVTSGAERDPAQEAALLAQCIACWAADVAQTVGPTPTGKHPSSNSCSDDEQERAGLVRAGSPSGLDESAVMSRLAILVTSGNRQSDSPQFVDWSQLIDLVGVAGLGDGFAMRLCERVLFSRQPNESSSHPDRELWSQEKTLLFKYTSILSTSLTRQQTSLGRRLSKLEQRLLSSEIGMAAGASAAEPDESTSASALVPLVHLGSKVLQEPWIRALALVGAICLPSQEPWLTRGVRVICISLIARRA